MERKFNKEDVFTLDAETTANFRDKIDELFEESNYPNDQARMIIEGTAYYDVEDKVIAFFELPSYENRIKIKYRKSQCSTLSV
ncbi:unnamed protein product [Cylicostephanus goldi]|uniref:Uncharacterized protein n=1 Tax=Cylicostephanus goldi TaxID=71465 RepID=A0A3P6T2K1_CYLGO|nr:unnamed protein product [Cylicostephanus goldi]